MITAFQAYRVAETSPGVFAGEVQTRTTDELPAGEVLLRVQYSSLNYKDALSASGNRGVTRHYPHTPGIDAVGLVVESTVPEWAVGAPALVTGFDLGMNTAGGWAGFVRVPARWVLPLPAGLDAAESMVLGTAGLTAGLSIDRLWQHGLRPGQGPVLVTGATGGVGSLAVAILARLGFEVVAASGKPEAADWLHHLGAHTLIDRAALHDQSGRALLKPQYAAAIDTVGGLTLATVLKSLHYGGAVAASGLVGGSELPTTVFPFILKGITLYGIDSVEADRAWRQRVWARLATAWKPADLPALTTTIALSELPAYVPRLLQGQSLGRVLVAVNN